MTELRRVTADELDPRDALFDSFRLDYPGFDEWLGKAAREKRIGWIVDRGVESGTARYAGVCIVHSGNEHGYGWSVRSFKLCSFKVCEEESSRGWGEILLRQALAHAALSGSSFVFLEVFPKHARLIAMLMTFGFEPVTASSRGEVVLRASALRAGEVP